MLDVKRSRKMIGLLLAVFVVHAAHGQESTTGVDSPTMTIEHFLPVQTANMTAGPFDAIRRSTGVSQPFFLIGCDDVSLEWLEKNRARLIELRAFGLVIDAPAIEAYRRLKSAAEGLVVRPVPGDLIGEHLRIRHYPALVTAEGIFP